MCPIFECPQTPMRVVEQYPVWTVGVGVGLKSSCHALAPFEGDYTQAISDHLTVLEEHMGINERVIKNFATVQKTSVND